MKTEERNEITYTLSTKEVETLIRKYIIKKMKAQGVKGKITDLDIDFGDEYDVDDVSSARPYTVCTGASATVTVKDKV